MTPRSRAHGWRRLAVIVVAVLATDQAAKAAVVGAVERGERVEALPFLDIVYVMNEGVAFGFLGGESRGLVLAITIAALLFVIGWFVRAPRRPWSWLALGLLIGGAAGNLSDRVFRGGVVDFIDLPAWPSFNVADIAITLGAILLVVSALAAEDDERDDPREEATSGAG